MTEQEFITLLRRFEKGLCSPEEQLKLEQWLDQSEKKRSPFRSTVERDVVGKALLSSIHAKAGISKTKTITMTPRVWMKAAAAVVLLILGCYGLIKFDLVEMGPRIVASVQAETQDGIRKVHLPDGSIVWLKAKSKLSYPESFTGKERVVSLVGEALFEVFKDPEHPFIIHTGDLTTKVLGTSFNIKNTLHQTEVYVLTGKVSVSLQKTNQKVELLSNEKILYSHATSQLQKEVDDVGNQDPAEFIRGTEYQMAFEDTRVDEIARRIEGKFGVKVQIEGDISSCVITADLTDQSLSSTLDIISEALSGNYEMRGEDVTLKGQGCQ